MLRMLSLVLFLFARHEKHAFQRTGKRNTNGPDMTIPLTTRQSLVGIALESLTSLFNTIREIDIENLLDGIQLIESF